MRLFERSMRGAAFAAALAQMAKETPGISPMPAQLWSHALAWAMVFAGC